MAPLTPSAVTPRHEEVINDENEEEEIEFANEDQGIRFFAQKLIKNKICRHSGPNP